VSGGNSARLFILFILFILFKTFSNPHNKTHKYNIYIKQVVDYMEQQGDVVVSNVVPDN